MHIASASITLQSSHQLTESRLVAEKISRVHENRGDNSSAQRDLAETTPQSSAQLSTTSLTRSLSSETGSTSSLVNIQNRNPNEINDTEGLEGLDSKTYQLKSIVESFTGKNIDLAAVRKYWEDKADHIREDLQTNSRQQSKVQYERYESIYEKEESRFKATGSVLTEDGREIRFNLSNLMQREYQEERYLSVETTLETLIDPIVIQLEANPISLTENSYQFDLDADGELENIHFVAGNNGFLAFDRNQNGKIDNGNELFGPMTGNGYQELARYDSDNNQFIDAKDEIYQHLSLWQKDKAGNDSLASLSGVGVGAIYLNSVNSPFALKDPQNNLQGMVRQSSIHINEEGQIGATHQIDLSV